MTRTAVKHRPIQERQQAMLDEIIKEPGRNARQVALASGANDIEAKSASYDALVMSEIGLIERRMGPDKQWLLYPTARAIKGEKVPDLSLPGKKKQIIAQNMKYKDPKEVPAISMTERQILTTLRNGEWWSPKDLCVETIGFYNPSCEVILDQFRKHLVDANRIEIQHAEDVGERWRVKPIPAPLPLTTSPYAYSSTPKPMDRAEPVTNGRSTPYPAETDVVGQIQDLLGKLPRPGMTKLQEGAVNRVKAQLLTLSDNLLDLASTLEEVTK